MRVSEINGGLAFLREGGAKHFLVMSYRATLPGAPEGSGQRFFASCFVIEAAGKWFVVTAGHVIRDIRVAIAQGAHHSGFCLHDKAAGNNFPVGVLFHFDANEWVVLDGDPRGTDYSAWPLTDLLVANLRAGGIQPVMEHSWGEPPFTQYPIWLLVGMPHERSSPESPTGPQQFRLVCLPLKPADPPAGAIVERRTFARIALDPERDQVVVNDIAGMSGGPIFGVRTSGTEVTYWVIGIQSSWYLPSRVISFCPAAEFFEILKEAWLRCRTGSASE